jgi:hypothetical protein
VQLQQHLAAQDAVLMTLVDKLAGLRTSAGAATSEG